MWRDHIPDELIFCLFVIVFALMGYAFTESIKHNLDTHLVPLQSKRHTLPHDINGN